MVVARRKTDEDARMSFRFSHMAVVAFHFLQVEQVRTLIVFNFDRQ